MFYSGYAGHSTIFADGGTLVDKFANINIAK
jgi:hypothetical protein